MAKKGGSANVANVKSRLREKLRQTSGSATNLLKTFAETAKKS